MPCIVVAFLFAFWPAPEESKYGTFVPDEVQKAAQNEKGSSMTQSVSDVIHTLIGCSIALAILAVVLSWLVADLVKSGKMPPELGFKLLGLILVVSIAAFVLVAGYGQNQIASLMGLLGAVLGYLFGKDLAPEKKA